jgi:hypothetical protein
MCIPQSTLPTLESRIATLDRRYTGAWQRRSKRYGGAYRSSMGRAIERSLQASLLGENDAIARLLDSGLLQSARSQRSGWADQHPPRLVGGGPAAAPASDRAGAFLDNADAPASLRTYLEEAFYFVPMLIGLTLEQSGEYESALEWFRTAYDYTAPKPEDRRIYYGLVLDGQRGPDDYRWTTSWLSDALNPHAIARTRRNAYTKYTLFSVIRCLLGFADSDFSQDTGEIGRARTHPLRKSPRALLGTDVLTQTLPDCSTIFGDPPGNKAIASLSAARPRRPPRALPRGSRPADRSKAGPRSNSRAMATC